MGLLNLRNITSLRNLIFVLIIAAELLFAVQMAHGASFSDSVLIGGSGPANTKSILELRSTTQAFLPPKMTATQRNAISSPPAGSFIYETVGNELNVYNGTGWKAVFDAGNLTGTIPAGSIPAPAVATLGGVFSSAAVSNQYINAILTDGSVARSRPTCSTLSDSTSSCSTANASANTVSTIVARDGSGNFSAGTITAALTGTASGNLSGTPSNHGMLVSSGTNVVTIVPPDSSTTKVWTSGGSSADPSWQTPSGSSPMTTLGDTTYEDATPVPARLPGNTTTTKKYLSQTGNGTISAAPAWAQVAFADISGVATIANGGTGQSSKAAAFDALAPCTSGGGGLIQYGSGTNTCLGTSPGDTGKPLVSGGGSVANAWATLGVVGGGTGLATITAGSVMVGNGTSAVSLVAPGTSGNVLTSNGTTWTSAAATATGGGLIGDRELISNTGIEVDASGYTAYADAAGVLPVDCTGGAPSSTVARSTTTPITGAGELLWSKTGSANRQGEGFSIPFTVGTADQAKVLQLDIDTIVRSGTFVAGSSGVDSDLEFYIYSVTDSQIIQPSTYKIYSNSTTGALHTTANFQTTSSGTSYRLCVHTATSSTANYTVGMDNISIHPSRYTYGAPITDWASYTPTFVGQTTPTSLSVEYRRVGSSLEIRGYFTTGTAGGGTASMTLPNGLLAGGTPSAITLCGRGNQDNTTNPSTKNFVMLCTLGSNLVQFSLDGAANAVSPLVAQIGTTVWFNTTKVAIQQFSVPIQGWSSTVQMSDSAPQSVVDTSVYLTSAVAGLTLGSPLKYDTVNFDTVNAYSTSTGLYTCKVPGKYRVAFTSFVTTGAPLGLQLNKNGAAARTLTSVQANSNVFPGGVDIDCGAGDTLAIAPQATATFGASVSTTQFNSLHISLISGLQTIGATETVAARYTNTSAQSIPNNANTTVTGWTKIRDTHSAFSTSGVFTAPIAGIYRVSLRAGMPPTTANVGVLQVLINQAGSATTSSIGATLFGAAGGNTMTSTVTDNFTMLAGDTLTFQVFHNNGAAISLSGNGAFNNVSIERVGL